MKDIVIDTLKMYYKEIDNEYKKASKEFFSKRTKWVKVYKREDICYRSYGNKDYDAYEEALANRQKIGNKRNKVKRLIKFLESEEK